LYKKILALALSLCLLLTAIPVQAQQETEVSQICQDIADDYYYILKNTNMASLQGYCGLMASWQLFFLGVNDWVMSHHGKDQFNAYKDLAVTSGGHRVKAYSAQDYTLEEALNAVTKDGTRNAYNILVGFQQTNTALGSIYGHSLVIYAILDGIVYFTEGFSTSMGQAGHPFRVTIAEFAEYYADWTAFEGIVVFGKKGYAANCTEYATNMFVEVTEQADVYSQPCTPEVKESESEFIRQVSYGERLWVNALYENPDGQLFYQIDDSGTAGYIMAEAVTPFRFVYEDIGISNVQNPVDIEEGENCPITGRIASEYSSMGAVYMTVTNQVGEVILNHALAKLSGVYDLESDTFQWAVRFDNLAPGNYTYRIYADGLNYYVEDGKLRTDTRQLQLVQTDFRVGDVAKKTTPQTLQEPMKDGWVWEKGVWYYFEAGVPRTGWYCYHGGDYYLKADGSVTTGWATINGKPRFFSHTGSMRTGWMETEAGAYYLMSNGVPATGWRTIDGKEYFFGEDGLLR